MVRLKITDLLAANRNGCRSSVVCTVQVERPRETAERPAQRRPLRTAPNGTILFWSARPVSVSAAGAGQGLLVLDTAGGARVKVTREKEDQTGLVGVTGVLTFRARLLDVLLNLGSVVSLCCVKTIFHKGHNRGLDFLFRRHG